MNAAYLEPDVRLDAGARTLQVAFAIRNDTSEPWRPNEGFGVGYHLFEDPMHLMSEVNRILKPGGHLVLTTPNIAALRGISGILQGYHPGFFHAYIRPAEGTGEVDARHNREYAPREIHQLLENSGFEVTRLETGEFRDEPHPEFGWILHLLERYRLSTELRGDGIYAVGRKTGAVRERYPAWLYT